MGSAFSGCCGTDPELTASTTFQSTKKERGTPRFAREDDIPPTATVNKTNQPNKQQGAVNKSGASSTASINDKGSIHSEEAEERRARLRQATEERIKKVTSPSAYSD